MSSKKSSISIINYGSLADFQPNILDEATEWEDFVSLWMRTKEVEQITQFFKGDIVCRVAIRFGEQSLAKFAKEVKEKEQTLVAYRRVARAFAPSKRGLNLTWTHYFIASQTDNWDRLTRSFKTNNRFKWLERAHDNRWSTYRMVLEIKREKENKKLSSAFEYPSSYIKKFRKILLSIDIKNLTALEKIKLVDNLESLGLDFQKHLGVNYIREEMNREQRRGMLEIAEMIKELEEFHQQKEGKKEVVIKGKKKKIPTKPKISLGWNGKNNLWEILAKPEDMAKIRWPPLKRKIINFFTKADGS